MGNTLRSGLGAALFAALALAPGARAENEKAILAIPGTNILFLVQYVAADEHLWSNLGLDVDVRYITGIGAMNAVIAASVEFSMSSGPSITRANARGQKLTALSTANFQSGQDVVIRKDIADAEHFDANAPLSIRGKIVKGRTFAVGGAAAIPDIVLKVIARDAGVARDDVTVTPMQPPEFMAAFARKAIDGFSNSPPFIQQVVLDGTGVMVSDATKGEPKEFSPVSSVLLLARADYCPAHPSVCAKMVGGVTAALRLIRTDKEKAIGVMKAHFPTYNDKVLEASYDMLRQITPDPPITTPQELENGDNMNIAAGFMKPEEKLPRYDNIIDNEFVK
ncbi:MAG TPA: ABC transporter substrate-binding protein [Stellaceae bacterium]|nr:ABC transporter substrate-binding protein [Stellaceae bacterium]